jgi:hypothetical protein
LRRGGEDKRGRRRGIGAPVHNHCSYHLYFRDIDVTKNHL